MKILAVMENLADVKAFSGGRYHAWLVCRAMQTIGHDVTVMTHRVPVWLPDLPGKRTGVKMVRPTLSAKTCFIEPSEEFDLVITFPIRATAWGVDLAEANGLPVWSWVFDPFLFIERYAPGVCKRMAFDEGYTIGLQRSTKIVSSVSCVNDVITEWTGNGNVVELPPCINSKVADKVSVRRTKNVKIVAITRNVAHKGPRMLFGAFKALRELIPEAQLVVFSGFSTGGLEQLARQVGVKGVRFMSKTTEQVKWKELKSATALLSGSLYEGFGLWLAEAIYAMTPFVVFNFPIFWELARGLGGYFADYGDRDALTQALIDCVLADHDELRMQLSAIAPMYGFPAFCDRVEGLF